jgi:exoribonuclease-2
MHVLYEDDGDLKSGTVRSATESSLQVDSTSGKRVKVKSSSVLLRFEQPEAEALLPQARAQADAMEIDFLWQCAPQEEFGFEQLAAEYCGHAPSAIESTAILVRLLSSPIHFQRKGRGRFRPAAPETLQAALAGVERRRKQEERRDQIAQELVAGQLPQEIRDAGIQLLIKPDRASIAYKGLEQAAHAAQLSPLRLLLARGAIRSPYRWHLESFLARAFPEGTRFPEGIADPKQAQGAWRDWPQSPAQAFSIDDSATTEIDDAFSVTPGRDLVTIGIHIAAPACAIARDEALDRIARERMSTVYAPGMKVTMLPDAWIDAFSLVEGRTVPVVSLYFDVDPASQEIRSSRSVCERIRVAANLRYDLIDREITAEGLETGTLTVPFAGELSQLWRFANALRAAREQARGRSEPKGREEYSLVLEGEEEEARVTVQTRRRDAPLDRIVAELMIRANAHWGAWLEQIGLTGVYRSQTQGRVRMATVAAPHEGLGVSHYAWCTSPLRRYVDLLNQRQILAAIRGGAPAHQRGDADLFAIVSGFDSAYTLYAEFQETMERYWSLRWLIQEGVRRIEAVVLRGEVVRLQGLPMVTRLPGAGNWARGQRLELELNGIDLVDLSTNARVLREWAPDLAAAEAGDVEPVS